MMPGHSILETTDYVIRCTGGRLVVPDTSFSQPFSGVEVIPTRVPVISESTCTPSIFWVPATQANLFPLFYYTNEPKHANEKLDHRYHRHASVIAPMLLSETKYF